MEENNVKVEFTVGSEIPSTHLFKSSFARSFVINYRDAKSLNTMFFDINNIEDENVDLMENVLTVGNNNNYVPVMPIDTSISRSENNINSLRKKQSLNDAQQRELNDLRKQCQALTEENRQLSSALRMHQVSNVQEIDSVFLQTQIDTLQWQLKQTEANRQMYQSLMKQVVHFLERARHSLDILHMNNSVYKNGTRYCRRQCVFNQEPPENQSSISSPHSASRFTRAKSVTQIMSASSCSGIYDFTWSMTKKNDKDLDHCSPPDTKSEHSSHEHINKTKHERNIHKCHNDLSRMDVSSDHTPPEKLSQEAFRLLRTIESLLAMREPYLTAVPSSISPSESSPSSLSSPSSSSSLSSSSSFITSSSTAVASINDDNKLNFPIEHNMALQCGKIINSPSLYDNSHDEYCVLSDNATDINHLSSFEQLSCGMDTLISSSSTISTLQSFSPNIMNMNHIINIEKNEDIGSNGTVRLDASKKTYSLVSTSTPNQKLKEAESLENKDYNFIDKLTNISNRADDESGFSSMNSFQDVGFCETTSCASTKGGCHTEIGLPEIALDKINHRRWSSTPGEIQALFKKYKNGFLSHRTNAASVSVWV